MASEPLAAAPATSRPMPFRWRADLEVRRQRLGGIVGWSVKDPLTLRHYHLRDEEYSLARQLDGAASLEQIRRVFEAEYPPHRLDAARFQALVNRLHADGLLVADTPGQGGLLAERQRVADRQARWRWFTSLLAWKLPGFDSDPLLSRLLPCVRWWFQPAGVFLTSLLLASAVALMAGRTEEFRERLPEWQEVVAPRRLPWLFVVLGLAKIAHELAHGLACRNFGAECRQMGVMFLLFTPCLYCDVSDAWRIPSRWRRAAVAAAGIWSDLTIASLSLWLWWWTRPGLINSVALDAVAICGVGTLLFNANPLLRYDGYFILSDSLDLPNLWQESRAATIMVARRAILGIRTGAWPLLSSGRPGLLALYGAASQLYLTLVTCGALALVWRWADRWQVEWLAMAVAASAVAGLVIPPTYWAARTFANPVLRRRIAAPRALLGLALTLGAVAAAFAWPWPDRVNVPIVLEPADAEPLYVVVAGSVVEQRGAGESLQSGDAVLRLDNPALRREIAQLEGEVSILAARLAQLEGRRLDDSEAAARIPATRESLASAQGQLEQRRRDLERLAIVAPRDGELLPPTSVAKVAGLRGQLPPWHGTPLDPRNRGATLEPGTLVGWVGDSRAFDAVAVIPEGQIERLAVGQRARVHLESWPGARLEAEVVEIARRDSQAAPRELVEGGQLAVRRDGSGNARPLETVYQARLRIDDRSLTLVNRARGEARISAAPRSLALRISEWLGRTFRWEE